MDEGDYDLEMVGNDFEEDEGPRLAQFQNFKSVKPASSHQNNQRQSSEANDQSNKRWENLYKLSEKMQKLKELRAKEHEERMNKDDEECTFQPQILPSSKKVIQEHFGTARGKEETADFYERKKEWKERQAGKLKELQEKEIVRESEKCTFKPQIESKSTITKPKQALELEQSSTTKKFLERQAKARQLNEEKKQALTLRKEYSPLDKKEPEGKSKKPQPKITDEFVKEGILSRPFCEAVLNLHSLLNQIEPKSYSCS